MDKYELKPEPKHKGRRNPLIWNILTALTLIGVVCLFGYFLSLFLNSSKIPAFLQPPPLATVYQTVTPTITLIQLEATWTPTPTLEPSPTRTKAPTWTQVPGLITPTITLTPTGTALPTITATPMPASVSITYQASTTIHPDSACKWFGVGGKVLKADGKPLQSQTVQLGGTLNNLLVVRISLSGLAPAYGASGFEFETLGDHPIASTHALWIQLFDNSQVPVPLTDKIYFDTYNDCTRNLVFVTFKMLH